MLRMPLVDVSFANVYANNSTISTASVRSSKEMKDHDAGSPPYVLSS